MTLAPSILAILERTRLGRAAVDFVVAHGYRQDHAPLRPPRGLTEKELYAWRAQHRLCTKCGVPLEESDKKVCADHVATRKKYSSTWRERHPDAVKARNDVYNAKRRSEPEKNAAYQRALYHAKRRPRVCHCGAPTAGRSKLCAVHRRKALNARQAKWQAGYRADRAKARLATTAGSPAALPSSSLA